MNNEFEGRNEMRKHAGPVEPSRDLWPAIAARIAMVPVEAAATTRRRYLPWMAIAATVLIAIGAGVFVSRGPSPRHAADAIAGALPVTPVAPATIQADAQLPATALEWAIPDDPTLARTAQNLDRASAQLQDALEQRPDAVFLVGLLNRTNSMRLRLLRKSPDAG